MRPAGAPGARRRSSAGGPPSAEEGLPGAGGDARRLLYLLLYGAPETRRHLAAELLARSDAGTWAMLAETVRSDEPWLLRARCLEALGLAAAAADRETAMAILAALTR